ncbi:hypothetical protein C8J57DRAFT_1602153 [Mycena rebaudengoi]|nr:hypothetical protein C8J57DRAFT_1602153 [Mycena rebaudengoi]
MSNVDSAQNGRRRASSCDAGDAAKPAHTDLMCGAALHSARRLHAEPRDPALVLPHQQSASADRTFAKLATSADVLVYWCCGAASVPPGGNWASVGASRAQRERGRARFSVGLVPMRVESTQVHQACAASTSTCAEDCAPSYNALHEGGVGGPRPCKSIRGPCGDHSRSPLSWPPMFRDGSTASSCSMTTLPMSMCSQRAKTRAPVDSEHASGKVPVPGCGNSVGALTHTAFSSSSSTTPSMSHGDGNRQARGVFLQQIEDMYHAINKNYAAARIDPEVESPPRELETETGPSAPTASSAIKKSAAVRPQPKKLHSFFLNNKSTDTESRSTSHGAPSVPKMPVLIPEELVDARPSPVPTPDLPQPRPSTSIFSEDDTSDRPPEQAPEPGGIIQAYLDSTLAAIKQQITLHGMPDCYRQGSFWHRPPDKWFALQKFKGSGDPIAPDPLYHRPVFVWLPMLLLPKDFTLKCLFCMKGVMTANGVFNTLQTAHKSDAATIYEGWNSNPVARQVTDLVSCYHVLTQRVACRHGCHKSCSLYDEKILEQLPSHLRSEFPAFLTHRSGIDKTLMTLVRSTIAAGLTPNAWERVLRELHVHNRDLAELSYLHALKACAPASLPSPLIPFSMFSDRDGYAGFSPSRWYINTVFVEYMGHIKPHQDQSMAALPATTISWDQSFKAVKYIARLDGVKAFDNLWSMNNHLQQTRQMLLAPTKHLHHIEAPVRGIIKSLHEHGHAPISLLWTDNVKADIKFAERVIPTLRGDVNHQVADGGRRYSPFTLPANLQISIASTVNLIDNACTSILADLGLEGDTKIVVGFSIEWDWQASKAGHFPAALMQIAFEDHVHLLQIYHIVKPCDVPESLRALLFSERVVKVGHHVQGNLDILSLLWELKPPSKDASREHSWIDLGILARSKGLIPHHSVPFARLAEEVITQTLESSEDMCCSNWCQRYLSKSQSDYAVKNAYLALHLYKAIVIRPPAGARLSRVGLAGDQITLRNGDVAVAHGIFTEQPTNLLYRLLTPIPNTLISYIPNEPLSPFKKFSLPPLFATISIAVSKSWDPHHSIFVVDLAALVSRELDSVSPGIDPSPSTTLAASAVLDNEDDLRTVEADSESRASNSDSDSEDESESQPATVTTSTRVEEDDLEEYMDAEIDAYIATSHQHGPAESPSAAPHHPLVQPTEPEGPRPTRVFQDTFHEMQRVNRHISKDHSLAKQFSRFLRDVLLVPDKIDKARVEAVLKKNGKTWEQAVRSKPDWIWDCVRRYVPPPDVVEPVLKKLFDTHSNLKCSRRNIRLFDSDTHKAVAGSHRGRANLECGSRHRDGVEYDGHYDIWIEDDIDIAYQSLPFDEPRPTRPGYINVSLFKPTHETFIISELPTIIRDQYNMLQHTPSTSVEGADGASRLPLVRLSGARSDRYEYLASAQNTKFAVVPIHTDAEYALFNRTLRAGGKFAPASGSPDFKGMARWWSEKANGKTIFYKLPEQLQAHFKTWTAARDEITTMHITAPERAEFMDLIRSDAHTSVVLSEAYSPVVQTRNAIASSATVAVQNRRAPPRPVNPPAPPSASSSTAPPPAQFSFVNTAPAFDSVTGQLKLLSSSMAGPGPSTLQARSRRSCAVCKSLRFDGKGCKGRGDRKRCPHYGVPGAANSARRYS